MTLRDGRKQRFRTLAGDPLQLSTYALASRLGFEDWLAYELGKSNGEELGEKDE